MANPLFDAIMGSNRQAQPQQQQTPPQQGDWQSAMSQLRANPGQQIRQAGYDVPDEIANNPQAAAMYIIQSGQVKAPIMQRIQPLINMITGRR